MQKTRCKKIPQKPTGSPEIMCAINICQLIRELPP